MIISTIILICSFYLHFPQGLSILFVSPSLLLTMALSLPKDSLGMVDTNNTAGSPSLQLQQADYHVV